MVDEHKTVLILMSYSLSKF